MKKRSYRGWAAVLGCGIAALIGLLYGLFAYFSSKSLQNEISLPLLAISGVVALLAVLALVAITFASFDLTDPTQALGLPPGSVRAVIALSLIVIFAIMNVYLFTSLSANSPVSERSCLTAAGLQEFRTTFPGGGLRFTTPLSEEQSKACAGHATAPTAGGAGAPAEPVAPAAAQVEPRFSVTFSLGRNPASEDFAKQLLVLIGTLVTSVAGFYFGAQAVAQAQQAAGGLNVQPAISGVDKPALKPGETTDFVVLGSNLQTVNQLQLVMPGQPPITATNVTSNSGRVQAAVNVPADAPAGPWDVVVADPQNRSARLAQAVLLGSPATSGASAPVDELLVKAKDALSACEHDVGTVTDAIALIGTPARGLTEAQQAQLTDIVGQAKAAAAGLPDKLATAKAGLAALAANPSDPSKALNSIVAIQNDIAGAAAAIAVLQAKARAILSSPEASAS